MSTRSTISILKNDGTIEQIYAHWDGYISNNGALLLMHYQDPQKVKELIALGNVSSLNKELYPKKDKKHGLNKDAREPGVTSFYGRDGEEEDQQSVHFPNRADFLSNAEFQDYNYVFKEKEKKWFLIDSKNKFKALAPFVEKASEQFDEKMYKDYLYYKEQLRINKEYKELQANISSSDECQNKRSPKV